MRVDGEVVLDEVYVIHGIESRARGKEVIDVVVPALEGKRKKKVDQPADPLVHRRLPCYSLCREIPKYLEQA